MGASRRSIEASDFTVEASEASPAVVADLDSATTESRALVVLLYVCRDPFWGTQDG